MKVWFVVLVVLSMVDGKPTAELSTYWARQARYNSLQQCETIGRQIADEESDGLKKKMVYWKCESVDLDKLELLRAAPSQD